MGRVRLSAREVLALSADVFQSVSWGFPATLGSSAALLAAVTGLFSKLDPLLIVPLALLCAILAVFFWACVIGLQAKRTRLAFDSRRWAGLDTYPVWVAAWLWIDMPPFPMIPAGSPAWPMLQKIKGAGQSGRIAFVPGTGSNMKSRISGDELRKLAAELGERPAFLYPKG